MTVESPINSVLYTGHTTMSQSLRNVGRLSNLKIFACNSTLVIIAEQLTPSDGIGADTYLHAPMKLYVQYRDERLH